MNVLLINGSPHKNGCTYTALSEVEKTLNSEGIETEIYWIGNKPIGGCIGFYQCVKRKKCVFSDIVNEFTSKAAEYDGFIFGSPVYYSGMNGNLMSFMDRVFYSASAQDPHPFRFKPAAAVVSARRAGTTSALDQIVKLLTFRKTLTAQPVFIRTPGLIEATEVVTDFSTIGSSNMKKKTIFTKNIRSSKTMSISGKFRSESIQNTHICFTAEHSRLAISIFTLTLRLLCKRANQTQHNLKTNEPRSLGSNITM